MSILTNGIIERVNNEIKSLLYSSAHVKIFGISMATHEAKIR
jgi:hypothetical protein